MGPVAEIAEPIGGPAQSRPGSSVSVLIVDDDTDHVEAVRRALRRHEVAFEVTHVRDGSACLEALAPRAYSLVLLDYRLPRLSGPCSRTRPRRDT